MSGRIKNEPPASLDDAWAAYQRVLAEYTHEVEAHTVDDDSIVAEIPENIATLRHQVDLAALNVVETWRDNNPIRVARREKGLAAQKLAAQVGVSHPTIQSWENGSVQTPNFAGMKRLAEFLDVPDLRTRWEDWHRRNPGPRLRATSIPSLVKIPG